MRMGFELFEDLSKNFDKFITPLFPPYYHINQAVKDIYANCICMHIRTHHVPQMEQYMRIQPPILLELFHFIREVTESPKMLNEPNNKDFRDLYNSLYSFFPRFLAFSKQEFTLRF